MSFVEEIANASQRRPGNMAAGIGSQVLQIRKERIKQSLCDFCAIGHRQEYVATVDKVMYYDDSNSENVNSTWFTLESIIDPVIWIAGGDDKGTDYSELVTLVKNKVKAVICIGNSKNLSKAFKGAVAELVEAKDMKEAVNFASVMAEEGSIVLLSPACRPDGHFNDSADRGNQFKANVKKLENGRSE